MQVEAGAITRDYIKGLHQKILLLVALVLMVFVVGVYAIVQGSYDIALRDILLVLFDGGRGAARIVITNIRLPRVVAAVACGAGLADRVQRTLAVPVVVLDYGAFATFDRAVYDALRIAGKILNRKKRADEVVGYIESLRKDLGGRTSYITEAKIPRVYVGGIGYRGAHGIESTEQHYIPFEWVRAKNVAEEVKPSIGSHVFMDKEMLLKLNPDIMFIDSGGLRLVAEDYRKRPAYYRALNAFAKRRVYTLLPFNWYATNIGTALADAYAIGKVLYPQRFKDIDPEKKADEIYTFLVGRPVYGQMKREYQAIGSPPVFTLANH